MTHGTLPRAALGLMVLEGRLVPTVSAAGVLDPWLPPPTSGNDSQPMLVGTDDQGEAIYTVTVQPGQCQCAACRGLSSLAATADLTATVVGSPVSPAVPATTSTPVPEATTVPQPVIPAAPSVAFSAAVQTPLASPSPVVITRSESGYSYIALTSLDESGAPDRVSTPPSAGSANPVAPIGGVAWSPWGDPFDDSLTLDSVFSL